MNVKRSITCNLILFFLCGHLSAESTYHPSGLFGEFAAGSRYTIAGYATGEAAKVLDFNEVDKKATAYLKTNKIKIVEEPKWNTKGVISIVLDGKTAGSDALNFVGYYHVRVYIDKPITCDRPDHQTKHLIWENTDFFYASNADDLKNQLLSSVDGALEQVVAEYNEGIRQQKEHEDLKKRGLIK